MWTLVVEKLAQSLLEHAGWRLRDCSLFALECAPQEAAGLGPGRFRILRESSSGVCHAYQLLFLPQAFWDAKDFADENYVEVALMETYEADEGKRAAAPGSEFATVLLQCPAFAGPSVWPDVMNWFIEKATGAAAGRGVFTRSPQILLAYGRRLANIAVA